MSERIRWEPTEPGGDDRFGYVGTLDRAVFTLWFPREDGVSWAVSAAIPGTGQEDAECRWGASCEEAMTEAESWLSEFVSSLGAIFPEEGDGLADWVMADRDRYGNAILRYRPTDGLYRVLPVEES